MLLRRELSGERRKDVNAFQSEDTEWNDDDGKALL